MKRYFRPIVQLDPCRPDAALPIAGGWGWFTHVEELSRAGSGGRVPVSDLPDTWRENICTPRPAIAGLGGEAPRIMGILNVTPDSFSDGGQHNAPDAARRHALEMVRDGADIVDIGGESTRPGAEEVAVDEEIHRTAPVIRAIREDVPVPVSIDTRKAAVATAAVEAGADLVNDVSGFTFDAELAPYCASRRLPVCVMHAQGDPQTMQKDPRYENVVLDVYDFLEARVKALIDIGIPRGEIIVDPGIGFGKTLDHNLALLRNLSLFHGLGCPILLGVSRKKFIATLGNAPEPADRMPGSVAVALAAVAQGVQILRVHDVRATRSALSLWQASTGSGIPRV